MRKYKIKDTGERLIPEYHSNSLIYAEHFIRYKAAERIVSGKTILDIACGTGYGSHMLASTAQKVTGVDISAEAIEYAKEHYPADNIEYLQGTVTDIPAVDNSFDVVLTFETIEHTEEYEKFIEEMKRVLKKDGLAVVSTPNNAEFAKGNHFHIHEFSYEELLSLLKKEFKYVTPYFQATWKYVAVGDENFLSEKRTTNVPTINLSPLPKNQYLYFYMLCSDRKITETVSNYSAIGEHYSERKMLEDFLVTTNELERLQEELSQWQHLHKQDTASLHREIDRLQSQEARLGHRVIRKAYKKLDRVKGKQ